MDEKYMELALKEAQKAFRKKEVPVGAVIVKNGKILSKAHNLKEKKKNVTQHAEIIAINKASKKIKNWRLNDCDIYVTVEPCIMCSGAIIQSRIKTIIYGTNNENYGFVKKNIELFKKNNIEVKQSKYKIECENIIKKFFEEKRNQNL